MHTLTIASSSDQNFLNVTVVMLCEKLRPGDVANMTTVTYTLASTLGRVTVATNAAKLQLCVFNSSRVGYVHVPMYTKTLSTMST